MLELLPAIKITAAYSNAVFTALFPYVADFAERIDAPVAKSLSIAEVSRFVPDRIPGDVGGRFVMRGGATFEFRHGAIQVFRTPACTFHMQDYDNIARFFGPVRISEKVAIQIARNTIERLGYSLEMLYADLAPAVEPPWKLGTNTIPRFTLTWIAPHRNSVSVAIEINANSKRVESLFFANANICRQPPSLNVVPEVLPGKYASPEPSPSERARFLKQALPAVTRYVEQLGITNILPLTGSKTLRCDPPLMEGGRGQLELTNGYLFYVDSQRVHGFYAPDAFFGGGEIRIRDFYGTWKLSEGEAAEAVIRMLRRLEVNLEQEVTDRPPRVRKPPQCLNNLVPRYDLMWSDPRKGPVVCAEVDAEFGTVKRLMVYVDSSKTQENPTR